MGSPQSSQKEPSPSSCYGSIDDLPLSVFIDCLTKKEYSGLVLQGEPAWKDISDAWLHLYSQFHERVKDMQMERIIDQRRESDALSSRLIRLYCLIEIASVVRIEAITEALQAEGFILDIEAEEDVYLQQLRVINAKLKPESMKLDRLKNEMQSAEEGKPLTAEGFTNTLMDISRHEGFRIRIQDVTTGEYCSYLRRLRDHIEATRVAQKN